jgi:hypothetical protein
MSKITWGLTVGAMLFGSMVLAASLNDFKEAAGKLGCNTIPYQTIREACQREQAKVDDWCKKPWSCDNLDPSGLTKQIENVNSKIGELKREKDGLGSKKSNAKDDSERRDLEDKINAKEKESLKFEEMVAKWERKLSDEKIAVRDRISIGEFCLNYRDDVARVFRDAKNNVEREDDPEKKPYAQILVKKYEDGERGHTEEIGLVKREASRSARACDEPVLRNNSIRTPLDAIPPSCDNK